MKNLFTALVLILCLSFAEASSVTSPNVDTFDLAAGSKLTVTADVGDTLVQRYNGPTLIETVSVSASASRTFGEYFIRFQFKVIPLTGSATHTDAQTNDAISATISSSVGAITSGTISGVTLSASTITDTGLTSGRVPVVSTGGLLADVSSLTFSAGTLSATTFSGALSGNATTATTATSATTSTTATNATNINITDDTTTNATMYPTWVTTTTGNLAEKVSSTKFTFNPSTGTLNSTIFSTGTLTSPTTSALVITNKDGTGTGNGGDIQIFSGTSGGGATGNAGAILLNANDASSTNGQGGPLQLYSGYGHGTGNGGTISETAGNSGSGATGTGGAINKTAGSSSANNGAGGPINLTTGNGKGSFNGGNFNITLGTGGLGGGVDGTLSITNHTVINGPLPAISVCGTSPSIVGSDNAMSVTVGSGGSDTSCVVTFNRIWTNAPACVAQSNTDILPLAMATTTTTATISKTLAFTAGSKLHVICMGF